MSVWGGLRVRVGINTGPCDVVFDEVTKGFDYYGTTVNTAARVEAVGHGGQVIATKFGDDDFTELDNQCCRQRVITFMIPKHRAARRLPIDLSTSSSSSFRLASCVVNGITEFEAAWRIDAESAAP